jgi:hypothetical protein
MQLGGAGDEVASPHGRCPRAEDNTLAHHRATTVQCSTTKGLMSALGQKQTWRFETAMSALPPKAGIAGPRSDVRFVPILLQKSVAGFFGQ